MPRKRAICMIFIIILVCTISSIYFLILRNGDANKSIYSAEFIDFYREKTRDLEGIYPEEGVVPDEQTAIKIAKAVWVAMFGKDIYFKQPFIATLTEDGIWVVHRSAPPKNVKRGGPYIEIQKKDGKIVKVFYTF